MPTKLPQAALPSRLIGYARVSTEEQGTDPQLDELRAAGCATALEEYASGADRSRPVLARRLHEIRPGETLVVVRLDRLARSVSHLLAVIEQLEAAGAHFRSLHDPIDTTAPQGMFSLQVLGAVAQLERALTNPAVRPRTLKSLEQDMLQQSVPMFGTALNERDAFRAIFSFGGSLS